MASLFFYPLLKNTRVADTFSANETRRIFGGGKMKIGIIRTSSIGDVVLATVCINFLKTFFEEAEIVWIGKNPSLSILKEAFPELSCIEIQKKETTKNILEKMSDLSFLLDLQTNLRSRLLSHSFKAKYKKPVFSCTKRQILRNRFVLEARIYGRRRVLSAKALHPLKAQYEMMKDSLISALLSMKVLENPPLEVEAIVPFLPTDHFPKKSFFVEEMKGYKWIAIAPGASYETKKAPKELWKNIFEEFSKIDPKQDQTGLLFLGDQKDSADCMDLLKEFRWGGPTLNLAGNLTLWENAVLLKRAAFLMSNDSSLAHIAEAVETPSLVLFGPTVEGFGFAPRKAESSSFSSKLGCRPCSKHGKNPCRFADKLCFMEISPQEVSKKMAQLLKEAENFHEKGYKN